MNNELNSILFKRRGAISVEKPVIPDNTPIEDKKALVATLSENLSSLGYRLSLDLANELLEANTDEIVKASDFLVDSITKKLGGDVEYHPMYPGFPDSVINRSAAQLYFDALVYFISGYDVLPYDITRDDQIKEEAAKFSSLKTIDLATEKTLEEISQNLMASPVAFSPEDKEDIVKINENLKDYKQIVPDKIPNKENLTWLAATYMTEGKPEKNPFMSKMNSAVDVMRLIVARNDGDTSLTEPVKFKSLPKAEVKTYANWFANHNGTEREIYNRTGLFKKINESYHFRSLHNEKLNEKLDRIYDKTQERSFRSQLNKALENGNFAEAVSLYSKNPGQMGADIANLASMAEKEKDYNTAKAVLCHAYKENAQKMAPMNLLKNESYLESRLQKNDLAVYSPNKGLSNPYMKIDNRAPLTEDIVSALNNVSKEELENRYAKKRPLGKVYIDESLKDVKIPSQQRTNSKGSVGLSFGSKLPVTEDIKDLRAFIWWTNMEKSKNYNGWSDCVDIDLSASLYDENMHHITDVSFYNLKGDGFATHSGDIRNGGPFGGRGVAEFIDVDLNKLKERDKEAGTETRYILFTVNSYTSEPFKDLPCKFGWMESDHQIAKNFDITKSQLAIDLTADSTRSIPALYDVKENKMIWMDRNPKTISNFKINGIEEFNTNFAYSTPLAVEVYRATHMTTPNLYNLMEMHAESRGEIVDSPEEADTLFTLERVTKEDYPNAKEFVCAFDNDLILGDLVSDELSQMDKDYFEELAKEEEKEEKNKAEENPIL